MRVFWKIYGVVSIAFVIVVLYVAASLSTGQLEAIEHRIVQEFESIGEFVAQDIERHQRESRWPFGSLARLSARDGVLFWWVVREDGVIHLADDVAFIGTRATDGFPCPHGLSQVIHTDLDRPRALGVTVCRLSRNTEKDWGLWIGFSTEGVSAAKREALLSAFAVSLVVVTALGAILYLLIRRILQPVVALAAGATALGAGDLGYRVHVTADDELGDLAVAFNNMASDLEKTTVSKSYVDSIIKSMVDPLIVVDPDFTLRTVNDATAHLLGYQLDDLVGMQMRELFADDARSMAEGLWQDTCRLGRISNRETSLRTKEGHLVPVLLSFSAMADVRADVAVLICSVRDITELRAAREALEASEARFRDLAELLPEVVFEMDIDGQLTFMNRSGYEASGYTPDDVERGLSALNLFAHEDRQRLADNIRRRLQGEDLGFSEYRALRKDGTVFPVLVRSACIMRNGELAGLRGFAVDITERKRTEEELARHSEELARSNSELEQFAYVASHDLQEPLRKVLAFGDRLMAKFGDELGESGRDYITRMQGASRRMRTLISDLLTYSRVATDARSFEMADLTAIVSGVLVDLEVAIAESGGRVEVGDLPEIEADPVQMRQLMQNLIGNALKYRNEHVPPRIHVSARRVARQGDTDSWQFTVEDNGIGFEPEHSDRIFGMFQRLHGRKQYEGTGVGLAVCRKIVERHGGAIWAEGRPGEGATFIVSLPVAQAREHS